MIFATLFQRRTRDATPAQSNHTAPITVRAIEGTSSLAQSLSVLRNVVRARLAHHFGRSSSFVQPEFTFPNDGSAFARFVVDRKLSVEDFIVLLLAVAPHAHPDLFSDLTAEFMPTGGDFPEFGGVKSATRRGVWPTGETVLFVLAGLNIDRRMAVQVHLSDDHPLMKERILTIESGADGEPEMSGRLLLAADYAELLLTGQQWRPRFGSAFPAKRISTELAWADLVLPNSIHQELDQIRNWLKHHPALIQDAQLGRKLKPGYRALFFGPPGTGKTLTASLLGQEFGKDVYRIDLSMVVSKYIGETEKNLHAVFETAMHKDWILFFDEADALFGKRTSIGSAHDRYANQEIAYLLLQIEEHNGLVILATNVKNNMDLAFMRRFQSVIQFQIPDVRERKALWDKTLPQSVPVADDVRTDELARLFELSGASILNVVQMSSLRALADPQPLIRKNYLLECIRKEYQKEGKTF